MSSYKQFGSPTLLIMSNNKLNHEYDTNQMDMRYPMTESKQAYNNNHTNTTTTNLNDSSSSYPNPITRVPSAGFCLFIYLFMSTFVCIFCFFVFLFFIFF